uniref:FZ domain-containing protein n=1 Tax=Romanomermis culicivorax TaxID=13658 RepID=A0A915L3T9_ROMCU
MQKNDQICQQPDEYSLCFGANITYQFGTLSSKLLDNRKISSNLALFLDYSGFPDCYESLRNLLCKTQFAPCFEQKMKLIPKSLCLETKLKCKFLLENTQLFPYDLENCTNFEIFTPNCQNFRENTLNFGPNYDSRKKCITPLVYSKYESNWLLPHCSLNCTNSLLNDLEHSSLQNLVVWLFVLIFPWTVFTFLTLIFNLEKNCKIENLIFKILIYNLAFHLLINLCLICGQNYQIRRLLICREDDSLRKFEIGVEKNYLCVLQFLILYYAIIGLGISLLAFCGLIFVLKWKNRPKMEQILRGENFLCQFTPNFMAKFLDCSVKWTFPDTKIDFYPREKCKLDGKIQTPILHLQIFSYFALQLNVNFCLLYGTKLTKIWRKFLPRKKVKNHGQIALEPILARQPDTSNSQNGKTQLIAVGKHQKLGDFQKKLQKRYSSTRASSSVPSSLRSTSLLSIHNRSETPVQDDPNFVQRYPPYPIYPAWNPNDLRTPVYFLPPPPPTSRCLTPQQFFPTPQQYFSTAATEKSTAATETSTAAPAETPPVSDEEKTDFLDDSDSISCDSAEEALIDKQFGISKSQDSLP